MTPSAELHALGPRIEATRQELAAAREQVEAEVARLVLDDDGDGLGSARAYAASLADALSAMTSRAEVLRYRIAGEAE